MTLHHVAVAAKDGNTTPAAIPGGIRQHDVSGTGAGPNVPELVITDSTGAEVLGTTADAAAATTDATPISGVSIWKQISKSVQAAAASLAGTLAASVTNAGTFAVQVTSTVSTAVTNAGTFAVQATLQTGANLIGAVNLKFAGSDPDLGPGTGGTKTMRVAFDTAQFSLPGPQTAAQSTSVTPDTTGTPFPIRGNTIVQAASSTITRPANTTAYAAGQLVANSTTAPVNLQFATLARVSGGSGVIIGAQIQKSGPIVTNAAFRLHLFSVAPTYVTAGDGSPLSTVVVASAKGYLGYIDITAMVGFSDVAWGSGAPDNARGGIPYVATAQIIYGLLEARGAYTPLSGEVITVSLDALQD